MIKVCDSIMGSGKTLSAIRYMNENKDKRFLFITPYLDETDRIKAECPDLNFIEPSNKNPQCGFRKQSHTLELLKKGLNVASTHAAFHNYTKETLEAIKKWGYTLILDEDSDFLEMSDIEKEDLDILVQCGYIEYKDDEYVRTSKPYNGKLMKSLLNNLSSRNLEDVIEEDIIDGSRYCWAMRKDILNAFENVFILTYMFECQSMYYYMKLYNIEYKKIGTEKLGDGEYRFSDDVTTFPSYVKDLPRLIQIVDNRRMNAIGDKRTALSKAWYSKPSSDIEQLKRNLGNYYNNMCSDHSADERLWSTFASTRAKTKGKGYTKSFLSINARATNQYRNKTCLAYPVNLYVNLGVKMFYKNHGIHVDEDMYALSMMVQWIWRSAIRDGKPIRVYVPSDRMRRLLKEWIDITSKGGVYKGVTQTFEPLLSCV